MNPQFWNVVHSFARSVCARAGIVRGGNPPRNRVLLRLPPGADLAEARRWLQQLIPEGKVPDYLEANRQEISRFEAAAAFLNFTAFLALVLGAGGVAIALRQHVEQGMTKLAIMKFVGARSSQIALIFALQIVWLMAGALAIGIPLGIGTGALSGIGAGACRGPAYAPDGTAAGRGGKGDRSARAAGFGRLLPCAHGYRLLDARFVAGGVDFERSAGCGVVHGLGC